MGFWEGFLDTAWDINVYGMEWGLWIGFVSVEFT